MVVIVTEVFGKKMSHSDQIFNPTGELSPRLSDRLFTSPRDGHRPRPVPAPVVPMDAWLRWEARISKPFTLG